MANVLPKWLMKRYSKLWDKFKEKGFAYCQASELLNENNEKRMNVIISSLRKEGWLRSEKNSEDRRKKIYYLKPPEDAIKEIAGGRK